MYPYGLIGNCQASALISTQGSIDWLCLPRPDSDPVFGKLLDPDGGSFSISAADSTNITSHQFYLENTNILITEMSDPQGNRFKITDFCPRFEQYGRMHRPMSIFRIVEPLVGAPFIRVSCKPIQGWNKQPAKAIRGNSHLHFEFREDTLRLTTNMPLTYLCEENAFQLKEKLYFALTWSTGIEDDLGQVSERFLQQTEVYWRTWVKHCSIPTLFQRETIRSALALKLHCYEDTGAILAALTTSLPEKIGGERNWDYRYCWLRDSYFVLSAFHNLGHFEEMEGFLKFFLDIAHQRKESRDRLAPVYTLSRELPLPEVVHPNWVGYKNSGPVRTKNQAAEHVQNDVYGEMILTLAPIYFDERFIHLRNQHHEDLLENLAFLCDDSISKMDAGLWEIRNKWQEHSFTNLMTWAGLERISQIQKKGFLSHLTLDVEQSKNRAFQGVMNGVHNGSIRNSPTEHSFDSSLALASMLHFPETAINLKTIEEIQKNLACEDSEKKANFFYRYLRKDDFGKPDSAFVICSFWVIQSLARLGKTQEANDLLHGMIEAANHVGLFSEHYLPSSHQQLGNFPQAYSHVGMINATFSVSPPWSNIL
jgi:GH15 family glucan-1,4-alpha-glucosidase